MQPHGGRIEAKRTNLVHLTTFKRRRKMARLSLNRVLMLMFELAFVVTRDNHLLDVLSMLAFAANLVQVGLYWRSLRKP